jgi:glycerophosphoryl diester phosphodiesterase
MLIYAHRGASGEFPEGTQAAYLAAISQGTDGFECDVRLTKDHQIICYHDSNTNRLSTHSLEIAKTTYQELKLAVNPYRLDQLLDLAISNKKDLVIESKHPAPSAGAIEKRVHKLLTENVKKIQESKIKVFLISFSYLATLRNKQGGFSSGYLIQHKIFSHLNPTSIIVVNIKIIRNEPSFVANQIKKGKKVMVFTVNEPNDLKLCQQLGVYAVMTDYPARARGSLGYS